MRSHLLWRIENDGRCGRRTAGAAVDRTGQARRLAACHSGPRGARGRIRRHAAVREGVSGTAAFRLP